MKLPTGISRTRKPAGPPVPFIVGVTRSGTTLLRLMLDAHPDLAIPPETHFVPQLIRTAKKRGVSCEEVHGVVTGHRQWGDFDLDSGELLRRYCALEKIDPETTMRAFFELYAEGQGKPRWGDKTPNYVKRMKAIERWIPEAHFVHMVRDGRDAALSRFKRLLKEPPPMDVVAERWVKKIEGARADGAELSNYIEVQYEELVRDTEPQLQRVCEFLRAALGAVDPALLRARRGAARRDGPRPARRGRQADATRRPPQGGAPTTSKPPDPSRLARWKEDMDPEQNAIFESVAGDLLDRARLRGGDALVSSIGKQAQEAWPRGGAGGRRAARRRPAAGAVRRRPDALGDDPAADDARRAPAAHRAAGDPLRPRPDQGRQGRRLGRRDARRARRQPDLGRLRDPRRGDAGALRGDPARRRAGPPRRRRARLLRRLRRAPGQAALG